MGTSKENKSKENNYLVHLQTSNSLSLQTKNYFIQFNYFTYIMSLEQVACEDLKAFERRLTEIISSAHPSAIRWRILLLVTSLCVAVGAVYWLGDPDTAEVPFFASLMNHPFFSLSALFIIILLLFG